MVVKSLVRLVRLVVNVILVPFPVEHPWVIRGQQSKRIRGASVVLLCVATVGHPWFCCA